MLKTSRYNFSVHLNEQTHLIFNGISGALYELNQDENKIVQHILEHPESADIADPTISRLLVDGGFLISTDLDEVEMILQRGQFECAHHTTLDLTISPSYECNFRCTYCYVDFVQGRMTHSDERRVIQFVERSLPTTKLLNLTWFGGEPLLNLSIVKRMNRQIAELCTCQGVQFNSFLTSNGYLLTRKNIASLLAVGIRFFHVTVDGPKEYHDRLRIRTDGTPTYKCILNNIMILLMDFSETHLTLRMNVEEANVKYLGELLETIPAPYRTRVQINIAPIEGLEVPPSPSLYKQINRAYRQGLEMGYAYYDLSISTRKYTFCNADKHNNFQIGPGAQIYKCSPSGKPETWVGTLDDTGQPCLNSRYEQWHGVPLFLNKCLECHYLCFCRGNCRLKRLRDVNNNDNKDCTARYQDIENLIINRYIAIVKSNINY